MDNWRRQKGDQYNPEFTRTKSHNKKPPLGNWEPTMPSWEKKFCKSVGCISWYKIMEMKRFTHLYENVIKWNDSAGEEAFHNAKRRFYAKIHGLPCDLSLPDPDLYIDKIDWNSQIDPELVLDIDLKPVTPKGKERYSGVVIMDSLLKDLGFSSSGWGDCEEKVNKDACLEDYEKGWGDFGNNTQCRDENNGGGLGESGWGDGWNCNNNNSWGQNGYENNDCNRGEWGDGWNSNNSWGQSKYEDNKNSGGCGDGWNSNNSWGQNKYEDNKNSGEWGDGRNSNNYWVRNDNNSGEWGNGWNNNNSWGRSKYENNDYGADKGGREGTGRYMPSYKTSRFSGGGDDRRNPKWRNGSGRNNNSYLPLSWGNPDR